MKNKYQLFSILLIMLAFTGCTLISCRKSETPDKTSFYTNVIDKLPINILINGDSIGDGLYTSALSSVIESEFGSKVQIDNISLPGNTSFAGFCQNNINYQPEKSYDLIFLCYGQNDLDSDNFSFDYENLLRSTIIKYPDAQILPILESSQKTYSNKIKKIMELCEYYNIAYVDTIHSFNASGFPYQQLTLDGIHPNTLGYKIYCQEIVNVLHTCLSEKQNGKAKLKNPINPSCNNFTNTIYVSKNDMVITDGVYSYHTDQTINAIGIDRTLSPGQHNLNLQVNDSYYDLSYSWNYDFEQRHIEQITLNTSNGTSIQIASPDDTADGYFNGIILVSDSE